MKLRTFLILLAIICAVGVYAVWRSGLPIPGATSVARRFRARTEAELRRDFYREHPGEKPLNWLLAEKADAMHAAEPMGKFVLHKNDCSDYMEAVVDDALGAQARHKRGSDKHILTRTRKLWDVFYWDGKEPLLPGDQVSVAHSPHYPPKTGSIGHCGIIGSDGKVRDWSKLRSWSSSRYGRNSVEWFTRHAPPPKGVVISRLRAEYRYRARRIPLPE